jgi:hypothetical protein
MIEKFFFLDDSPLYKNKYVIRFNVDLKYFPNGTTSSYGVFIARLLNLPYPEYLRYCRDVLGAELIGKGSRYIVGYFDDTPEVQLFIKLLNTRMAYIINERDFPYEYVDKGEEVERVPFGSADENNS